MGHSLSPRYKQAQTSSPRFLFAPAQSVRRVAHSGGACSKLTRCDRACRAQSEQSSCLHHRASEGECKLLTIHRQLDSIFCTSEPHPRYWSPESRKRVLGFKSCPILLKLSCCIGRVTWRQCAQFYQRQRSLQRLRACSPPRSVHRKSVAMGRLTLPRRQCHRHWPQSTRAPHTARTSATACRYGSAFKHGAALPHWSAARSAPNAR